MWGMPDQYLKREYFALEEYWQWLQVPEVFGYGIRNHPEFTPSHACGDYWNQTERYYLANAIAKAEDRLEADRWLGFPLRRKYEKPQLIDYKWPLYLGKYVRGVGIEAEVVIQLNQPLTLRTGIVINDPVTFTIAVTFTDPDELVLYYTGQTKYSIRPSSVTISGGVATVEIPRARLLDTIYFKDYDDVNDRPDYDDDTYFVGEVDVYRNYLNTTTGCNLVWHRRARDVICCSDCTTVDCTPSNPCGETLQLACGYVRDQRNGLVQLEPATYDAGWNKAVYAICREPDMTQINFMRGYYDRYEPYNADITKAVVALAHNNMPTSPCLKCAVTQRYYETDNMPLEPPVNLGLGRSTWGTFEAVQTIREFDNDRNSHHGGMI